jgi:predicted nucleic acid-binding protein
LEARGAAVIVVDTNVICYRWMSSPNSAAAEAALTKDPHWIAPLLWRSEFRNIVALAIRKKAITIQAAREIMRKAEATFEHSEFAVSSDAVLQLVARSNCTAYDCEFVALADAERVQLVTADRQILHEFPEVAISLDKFVRD